MKILLTNDDGYHSEGLKAMWRHLKKIGDVSVIVPATEKSGTSHAITLFSPVKTEEVKNDDGFQAHLVSGTPADCVKIGVNSILTQKPDLLISGINPGANTGVHIRYSGTVSAAAEGIILGIPSIAVSVVSGSDNRFNEAGEITIKILEEIKKIGFPTNTVLNINIPNCDISKIKGIKTTYQDSSILETKYEEKYDQIGNAYYWMKKNSIISEYGEGSDREALSNGYISITPLHINMTDHLFLSNLKKNNKFENIKIK